jgi:hypothetical protein
MSGWLRLIGAMAGAVTALGVGAGAQAGTCAIGGSVDFSASGTIVDCTVTTAGTYTITAIGGDGGGDDVGGGGGGGYSGGGGGLSAGGGGGGSYIASSGADSTATSGGAGSFTAAGTSGADGSIDFFLIPTTPPPGPVPEPGSFVLLATGVIGFGAVRRWRRRVPAAGA